MNMDTKILSNYVICKSAFYNHPKLRTLLIDDRPKVIKTHKNLS